MADQINIRELLQRYLEGTASTTDIAELMAYYRDPAFAEELGTLIGEAFAAESDELAFPPAVEQEILAAVWAHEPEMITSAKPLLIWKRVAAAASVLLVLGLSSYWLLRPRTPENTIVRTHAIVPGGNKAFLTLASGKRIILTGAGNGQIASEGNALIDKKKDGELVYEKTGGDQLMAYNTISTPAGGQYTVSLADGTRVTLNAGSTLRYPTSFSGNSRRVELTGEGYFEVAHDKEKPFRVVSGGQTVEVLGTHFNISAYGDDSGIRTTLLEGSVKVSGAGTSALMTPGQQAIFENSHLAVDKANTREAVAWKNGYFNFSNEGIQSIMRKLSRWYDIDVQYNGKVTNEGFYGEISRFKNIGEVLKMLEQTELVHFKIEGRRVVVMQ